MITGGLCLDPASQKIFCKALISPSRHRVLRKKDFIVLIPGGIKTRRGEVVQYLVLLGDMEVRSLEVRREFLGIWCFKNQGQMLGGFWMNFHVSGEVALSDWRNCDREA